MLELLQLAVNKCEQPHCELTDVSKKDHVSDQ